LSTYYSEKYITLALRARQAKARLEKAEEERIQSLNEQNRVTESPTLNHYSSDKTVRQRRLGNVSSAHEIS